MTEIAQLAHAGGWRLRSGAAQGADQAFEAGAPGAETYLPWEKYEREALAQMGHRFRILKAPSQAAIELVDKYHPAADRLSQGARKLHARNGHIVLGRTLDDPVDAIIAWTQDAKMLGGTAGALRIALDYDIPVLNLGDGVERTASDVFEWLNSVLS